MVYFIEFNTIDFPEIILNKLLREKLFVNILKHKINISYKSSLSEEQAERLNENGKLLGRAKKDFEALEYFSAAAEMCPKDGKYRYNMGIALKKTDRKDEALRSFIDALELGYEHCDCYCAIGVILKNKGEYELAESYFSKALLQNPEYLTAIEERATAYFYSGQYEKALEDVNKLLLKHPDDSLLYLQRALIYSNIGMTEKHNSDLEKAMDVQKKLEREFKKSKEQKPQSFETTH